METPTGLRGMHRLYEFPEHVATGDLDQRGAAVPKQDRHGTCRWIRIHFTDFIFQGRTFDYAVRTGPIELEAVSRLGARIAQ